VKMPKTLLSDGRDSSLQRASDDDAAAVGRRELESRVGAFDSKSKKGGAAGDIFPINYAEHSVQQLYGREGGSAFDLPDGSCKGLHNLVDGSPDRKIRLVRTPGPKTGRDFGSHVSVPKSLVSFGPGGAPKRLEIENHRGNRALFSPRSRN